LFNVLLTIPVGPLSFLALFQVKNNFNKKTSLLAERLYKKIDGGAKEHFAGAIQENFPLVTGIRKKACGSPKDISHK